MRRIPCWPGCFRGLGIETIGAPSTPREDPIKRSALAVVATLMATALTVTACGSSASDKSGVRTEPIALVLANSDGSTDGIPAIVRFVDRVEALSGGRISITVKSQWGGDEYNEAGLIRDVAAGRADLGWAGTRALDLVGVQAFRALHAPFLVTSLAAQAAIVRDPLARTMLDSLQSVKVTGLALLADEIRNPVGVAKPLLTPEDFRGITFQSFPSGVQAEGIRALGATPTTEPVRTLAAQDELGGLESMWWTYVTNNYPAVAPYVTANVGLWPRTSVLFANTSSLSRLDPEARQWVSTAAAESSDWATAHALDAQNAQVVSACVGHARIALATDDQLAALRKAVEPMYAALRVDPAQGPTLERIEQLVAKAPADAPITIPDGCAYRPGRPAPTPTAEPPTLTVPGDPGTLPQGVYRYSNTEEFLTGKGLSDHDAFINAGVWTWTLAKGEWHQQQQPIDPSVDKLLCEGYYDVHGTTVDFTRTTEYVDGSCAPDTWSATWSATTDTLTWTDVSITDGFQYEWAPRPWKKID